MNSQKMMFKCKDENTFKKIIQIFSRGFYVNNNNIEAYKIDCNNYIYVVEYVMRNIQTKKNKLTKEQEKEIYEKKISGVKVKDLSKDYEIGKSLIYQIVKKYSNPYEQSDEGRSYTIKYHENDTPNTEEIEIFKQLEEMENSCK